jgi:hypothetical protein
MFYFLLVRAIRKVSGRLVGADGLLSDGISLLGSQIKSDIPAADCRESVPALRTRQWHHADPQE